MHFSHKYKTSFFLSLLHHSHEHLIHKLFLPHEVVLKMMELSISTHTYIHAHAATASRTMFIPSSTISDPLFSPLLQSRPRHARLYLLTPSSSSRRFSFVLDDIFLLCPQSFLSSYSCLYSCLRVERERERERTMNALLVPAHTEDDVCRRNEPLMTRTHA